MLLGNMRKSALGGLCLAAVVSATAATSAVPPTLLMDGEMLVQTKARVQQKDAAIMPAYEALIGKADAALKAGVFSVMNKDAVPPSGDKHDYTSMGRYWWPDPSKPDGLPYIRRDGETNPESKGSRSDRYQMDDMVKGVEYLGLAYYFTGEQRYADHAAELLRVWFLNEETRMNPNLNFAQGIPGREAGRKSGLIDARILSRALDGLMLIHDAGALDKKEWKQLVAWFEDYLEWLKTNQLAIDESKTTNNHATFFDVQAVHIALFVGDKSYAKQVCKEAVDRRIAAQIESDGSMPEELARTKSFHYSVFNAQAFFQLARLAEHVNVDLWSAEDERIRAALDYIATYVDPAKKWPHRTLGEIERLPLLSLLIQAARVYEDDSYLKYTSFLPNEKEEQVDQLVVPLMR